MRAPLKEFGIFRNIKKPYLGEILFLVKIKVQPSLGWDDKICDEKGWDEKEWDEKGWDEKGWDEIG